jgi:hypothetical protein
LLSFANPNFLGSKNDFRKNFENVIIRGRDADATDKVKATSEKKLKELGEMVSKFIIRRTNDLLSKYRAVFILLLFPYTLTSIFSSGQIRTCRILWTIRISAFPLQVVHFVSRDSSATPGRRLAAFEGDQHPQETLQSP